MLELKVKMDADNLTSIDLTINNWDDREKVSPDDKKFGFKYSDTDTFDIGNRIHVEMGYVGKNVKLLSMANGIITTLTPRFPESGPPTLGVSALDSLVKLRDRKPSATDKKLFLNQSDSKIAEIVASRNQLKFSSDASGREDEVVAQGNYDEVQFLKYLASRNDFDCYIEVDPKSGKDTLYFRKPTDGRPEGRRDTEYVFEWGKSLMNFSPTLSVAKQVGSVTVRGWNPGTKEPITYTATQKDLPQASGGGGSNGPKDAEERLGGKSEIVVTRPVTSAKEAQDLAISILRERAYEYVEGSGQIIGLPDLRPGDNVNLEGLGKYGGRYYVREVEHTLGSSGYLTQFKCRRFYGGGPAAENPTEK